jgi:DNA polymerase elongation subunit (family B)
MPSIFSFREYDVPYHVRVSIDKQYNVGHWFSVRGRGSSPPDIKRREDLVLVPVSPDILMKTLYMHVHIYWGKTISVSIFLFNL